MRRWRQAFCFAKPLNNGIDNTLINGVSRVDNTARKQSVYNDYMMMTDDEIVDLCRADDDDAFDFLLNKYKNFVQAKARSYFLVGADRADIIQEGMIGLYKAIRDYKTDKQSSFRSFAELCIQRQIITAIKTATRQKHIPLNSYISLNKPIFDEESDRTLIDVVSTDENTFNPEEMYITQEDYSQVESRMMELLSDLEMEVLSSYLQGRTYQEIASAMTRQVKSIDNALQRVKRKLEKYLVEK